MATPRIDHLGGELEGVYFVAGPANAPATPLAKLRYAWRDGVMAILHVGVDETLRGQGVARSLVERAVGDARERGFRIAPRCSYARKYFEQGGAELDDVRAPE